LKIYRDKFGIPMVKVKEASWYRKIDSERVQCILCPHNCVIPNGKRGFCGVRENKKGTLYTLIYGLASALNIDPIEKKPLYHFYPGSPIVSVSTAGCNFRCPWCQNYNISQARPEELFLEELDPSVLIKYSLETKTPFIAFTYNEPLIWYEYILDVCKLAVKHDIKLVLVTNGYINLEPLEELVKYINAANVDIKAFSEETYRRYIKADLRPVLEATEFMKEKGVHIETTYLVIPELNDSLDEFKQMVHWHLETLGAETPLHISRFFPMYKFIDRNPTPVKTLKSLWETAKREGLHYVYVGNLPGNEGENTYCPKCGQPVISRIGFWITGWKLTRDNRCINCGAKIPIIGYRWPGSSGG